MRWPDYTAIGCALLLALWADYDAGIALRASIVTFLVVENDWVRGYDLRQMFGPSVYRCLHRLVEDELVDRREEPGGLKRGERPEYLYRWGEAEEDET